MPIITIILRYKMSGNPVKNLRKTTWEYLTFYTQLTEVGSVCTIAPVYVD